MLYVEPGIGWFIDGSVTKTTLHIRTDNTDTIDHLRGNGWVSRIQMFGEDYA